MQEFFVYLLNMSITASSIILAVIILRFFLKKAPAKITGVLWGLVVVRLVCPFSFESIWSLVPSSTTITPNIRYSLTPEINSGVSSINRTVNRILSETMSTEPTASVNPMQVFLFVASIIWIFGFICLALFALITFLKLKHQVSSAVPMRGNIYQCDAIASPFVLGMINPRIYIPFSIDSNNLKHIIAHEEAHIKRLDHWVKPFGFLLLALYWFNPLVWAAYLLFCKDIEIACDEKVIRKIGIEDRKSYSMALLDCSADRRKIAMCPLAFGETGVRQRVKNILHYKKPALWIIIAALISCVVVAICFLTNPSDKPKNEIEYQQIGNLVIGESGCDVEGVSMSIKGFDLSSTPQTIAVQWDNRTSDDAYFGEYFWIYRLVDGEWISCLKEDAVVVWLGVGHPVYAGSSRQQIYQVSQYFDITGTGTYKLQTNFHFVDDRPFTEENQKNLWVEFSITD